MSERIQALAQSLTGKASVEECTLEELTQLAQQYPYFAPVQFLLLEKLKAESSSGYAAQQQKAVLYYHDSLAFEAFISSNNFLADDAIFEKNEIVSESVFETQETYPEQSANVADDDDQFLTAKPTPSAHNAIIFSHDPDIVDPPATERSKARENFDEESTVDVSGDEPTYLSEGIEQNRDELIDEETKIEEVIESTDVSLTTSNDDSDNDRNKELNQPSSVSIGLAEPSDSQRSSSEETNAVKTETALLFEPYHTVDYFASQGIKFSADETPKDKLGKQLRSFTEWLKTMKRLPATEMVKAPESTAEKSVENMANHSVEESDVVTEAMAEVWAKQGAREKAVETYNKLSLLNPSKRAYFAAKIENLK